MGVSRREQAIRDREICLLHFMEGISVSELAKKYHMTETNLRNILKKGKAVHGSK